VFEEVNRKLMLRTPRYIF